MVHTRFRATIMNSMAICKRLYFLPVGRGISLFLT